MAITSQEIKGGMQFSVTGMSAEQVADKLNETMIAQGYKLEKGDKMSGSYGTGSAFLRVMFGALVKRVKLNFQVTTEGNTVMIELKNDMWSKVSGGLIGMAKASKEFKKVVDALNQAFAA